MKSNSQTLTMASNLFTAQGVIQPEVLTESLEEVDEDVFTTDTIVSLRTMTSNIQVDLEKTQNLFSLVRNGDIGLSFTKTNTIDEVLLNNEVGLKISGHYSDDSEASNSASDVTGNENIYKSFFQVNNKNMGFFKIGENNTLENMLYFDATHGDMKLAGGIEAKWGSIGGWTIGSNYLTTNSERITYNDTTHNGITITSTGIGAYANNNGVIRSFSLDTNNGLQATGATISGAITATSGSIGGWTIGSNLLSYGGTVPSANSMLLKPSGISSNISIGGSPTNLTWMLTASNTFGVTTSGALYANSGQIGGFLISNSEKRNATSRNGGHRYTNSLYTYTYVDQGDDQYECEIGLKADGRSGGANNVAFYGVKKALNATWEQDPTFMFYINQSGRLYATGAEISGKLTATSGSIGSTYNSQNNTWSGGWQITANKIYSGNATPGATSSNLVLSTGATTSNSIAGSSGEKTWMITAGTTFGVTTNGVLYATGANISGIINA